MMGGNTTSGGQMGVTNMADMMQMQMQRNPMDYANMMNGREQEMSQNQQPNPLGFNNLMLPTSKQFNQKF